MKESKPSVTISLVVPEALGRGLGVWLGDVAWVWLCQRVIDWF